jgi:hypothetical protein
MKTTMFGAFGSVAMIALLAACGTETGPGKEGGGAAYTGKTAKLEFFVMSQCPYGVQVEKAITPVKEQLGGALELTIDYIGDGEPGAFTSMHGPAEVRGNIAQLCANSLAPEKSLDFIECQNENPKAVDTNWRDCASANGISAEGVEACINGDDGQQLLAKSYAAAAERHATGSPTIFLNGEKYTGGRKPTDFLKAVCAAVDNGPEACKSIPEAPKVAATFFSDERCGEECDLKRLEPRLKNEFGGLQVTYVDYGSAEGKALYAELKGADAQFKHLPVVLFDESVDKDADGKAAIGKFLRPMGKYQELKLGGKFDPTAEICDNAADDDADGLADCADDGCKEQLVCRTEIPKKLDLFVMSQCPYGAKAMIAANDFVKEFGGDVELDVHFIGNEQDGQLTSMHGPAEVDEDVRELCAEVKYPNDHQFLQYMACRSKDYKSAEWQGCATSSGMDPAVIQACFDGEGKNLLREDFAVAQGLGFGASPTFLANNRREFNAIQVGKLQQEYCKDNQGLAGCAKVLTDDAAAAAPVPAGECK